MDLGVLLESPQGSQSSSRLGACMWAFLPNSSSMSRFPSRGSRDQGLSLKAFPRGFPTRLFHRAVPRATVVCFDPRLESRGSAGKKGFPAMDGDIWLSVGMVARPWSSSRLSCGERLLLRCDGNAGNSFLNMQGKDPSSRARRLERGSSGCGRDSRASSRVETSMSGNFLSCSKGVKDPVEVPDVRCD